MTNFDPELQELLAEFPPLAPAGEPAADDSELAWMALEALGDVHALATATTWNEKFGNVVRIDYHIGVPEYSLRLIAWRKPNGEFGSLVCTVEDAGEPLPA